MIFNTYLRSALLATLLGPGVAAAQTVIGPQKSQAPALNPAYQSAFTDYKAYQEPVLTPWQTANDVVREFGGMSGMNSGDMKEQNANTAPGSTDNMEKMNDLSVPPPSNARVAPGGNVSEMDNMPGHDMSKMQSTDAASKSKVAPQPNTKNVQRKDMADMPGHDMSQMKAKKAPTPAAVQPSVGKPAAAPPRTMPDHSGMGH